MHKRNQESSFSREDTTTNASSWSWSKSKRLPERDIKKSQTLNVEEYPSKHSLSLSPQQPVNPGTASLRLCQGGCSLWQDPPYEREPHWPLLLIYVFSSLFI